MPMLPIESLTIRVIGDRLAATANRQSSICLTPLTQSKIANEKWDGGLTHLPMCPLSFCNQCSVGATDKRALLAVVVVVATVSYTHLTLPTTPYV